MASTGSETPDSPTTPEALCADCPAPPESSGEWLSSAIGLSIFPFLSLAFGLLVAYSIRQKFTVFTRSDYGFATLAGLLVVGVIAFVFDAILVGMWAVAFAVPFGVVMAISREVGPSIPFDLLDRADVWIGGSLVVLVGHHALVESTPKLTTFVLSLIFLGLLSYPLGLATGRLPARRAHYEWGGVTFAMAVAVVTLMGQFVPSPGGPAVLVSPAVAILVFAVVLVTAPLIVLGEERAAATE